MSVIMLRMKKKYNHPFFDDFSERLNKISTNVLGYNGHIEIIRDGVVFVRLKNDSDAILLKLAWDE